MACARKIHPRLDSRTAQTADILPRIQRATTLLGGEKKGRRNSRARISELSTKRVFALTFDPMPCFAAGVFPG